MADSKHFLGFVLLRDCEWDSDGFFSRLADKWGIRPEKIDSKEEKQIFVFDVNDMHVSLAFFPAAVPNHEAEQNAAFNYMWRGAAQEVAKHTAQVVVSVSSGSDVMEMAQTFVKACDSCIDGNTVGIYTNGIVYEPSFYAQNAALMSRGELPLLDLVWPGLSMADNRLRGYSMGLENFGKHEIEVVECNDSPKALLNFMAGILSYILSGNVTLHDGETIGFTPEQRLKITLSRGVEFGDKDTLKIEYPG